MDRKYIIADFTAEDAKYLQSRVEIWADQFNRHAEYIGLKDRAHVGIDIHKMPQVEWDYGYIYSLDPFGEKWEIKFGDNKYKVPKLRVVDKLYSLMDSMVGYKYSSKSKQNTKGESKMKKCSMQKKKESLAKKSKTLGNVPQEVMDFINNDADFQTLCKENHVDKSDIELFLDVPEYVLSIHECSDLVDMFDEMDEIVEYLRNEGLSDSEIESFLNLDSSIYCPSYGGVDYWEDGSVGRFNYFGLSGLVYPERSDTHCKDLITSTRKYRAFIDRCKEEMADDTLALNALEAIDD